MEVGVECRRRGQWCVWTEQGLGPPGCCGEFSEMGASGGAEDRSHLVWLLLFFLFLSFVLYY